MPCQHQPDGSSMTQKTPHPKGDHGREVEGAESCAHAQWLPNAVTVDASRHVFKQLAHEERSKACCLLDHL